MAVPPNDVPPMENVDICGIACRFPESNSPSEFYDNLFHGRDMVTDNDRKWTRAMWPDVPARCGKLKENELSSFDQHFFTIHGQQAKRMDPQIMKLFEVAWEAWMDSGIDVRQLRDSNRVGVYTGICGSEVHGAYLSHCNDITGYEQTGCTMCMAANRISYFFSFRGPSKTCDTACSSAAISLHDALADIAAGRTDYAIVLGAMANTSPAMTMAFNRLHMLSPEGMCKAFDAAGNGYVRAEGMAGIVLKRSDLADVPRWANLPPYATLLNAGTNNDGFTKEGLTFPSAEVQESLERQVCTMAGVNPADVVYVEAHGTGTVAGDGQELAAIDNWYGRAPGRQAPLLIGSVKSNMGHCEACSCLAGLVKVCLSLEYGYLPGQLHYYKPNPESAGLRDGTLKVVDKTTEFEGGIIALSSFGFGGSNCHFLLHGAARQRQVLPLADTSNSDNSSAAEFQTDNIIPLAARTPEGLADLAKAISDAEAAEGVSFAEPLRRYANCAAPDFKLSARGILVDGELKTGAPVTKAPEVWFAFSGNGSQWSQMGKTLLQGNATFAKAVAACAAALEPYGVDLQAEFANEKGWKGPMLASVGLLAVQVGLVDVLKEDYGITPDGIFGHSAGEIACTYASGCCTKEQAVLIAYHRGRLPMAHGVKDGLMAATGLSAEQARARVQGTKIVLACDNSPKSTTVSGPSADVLALVKELEAEGIFARALDTNGVPYHSAALEPLLPELDKVLRQVIPDPQPRPASWVSAAFPENSNDPEASLCSAGYQVFSYRNPVLMTDAAKKVPADAILVEIGPHSILRSPLRQTRPDLSYVNAMRKGECGLQSLSAAVGELWRKGAQVEWRTEATPTNEVGAELPRNIREALVSWDRTVYDLPMLAGRDGWFEKVYKLGGEDSYICDHKMDGVVFIPFSCFLVTAWEGFAYQENKVIWDYPVEFSNVVVLQPVRAEETDDVKLLVKFDAYNNFEVKHGADVVCEGTIAKYDTSKNDSQPFPRPDCRNQPTPTAEMYGRDPNELTVVSSEDWYRSCDRQDMQYGSKFQMVAGYAVNRTFCDLKWDQNWIIHLDGIFQTAERVGDHDLHLAKGVRRLVILDTMKDVPNHTERVDIDIYAKVTRSRSMLMEGFIDEIAPSKPKHAKTMIHNIKWIPYGDRVADEPKRAAYVKKIAALLADMLPAALDGAKDAHLLKIKEAALKLADGATVSVAEKEALLSAEDESLAAIFAKALSGKSAANLKDAILKSPDLSAALEEDLVLSGTDQRELESILGIAVMNMGSAGYSVLELGAGKATFTKSALKAFITIPQSTLLQYTATDVADQSSDFSEALSHNSLSYKPWDFNTSANAPNGRAHIIVARHLSRQARDLPTALANIAGNMPEGGFLLLDELTGPLGACVWGLEPSAWEHTDGREFGPCTSVEHWARLLSDAGLAEICTLRYKDGAGACFLYRKLATVVPHVIPLEAPLMITDAATMDMWLKDYIGAMSEADPSMPGYMDADGDVGNVWVFGNALEHPGIRGYMTSARKEFKGDRLRMIFDRSYDPTRDPMELIDEVQHLDLMSNVFVDGRHGTYVPMEIEYKAKKEEADAPNGAHLEVTQYGNLKSITWAENQPVPMHDEVVLCDVAFGALNFRDVMLAYGKLSKSQMHHESGGDHIGFEFSGNVAGTDRRVMGSAKNAISTRVATKAGLIWDVPEHWSLAEAATVPTAYMTAYYSLVMRGRLRKGMRVLIHSGTGAVGLAAIQIALNRGAEVYTTVGTAAKRQFLLDAFPQLDDAHIANSRTREFESVILNGTKGRGVHLALNSLADDKLQATVRCIGHNGRLLEIGKYDILKGTPLSMKPMLNNIAYEGIDVDRVMNSKDTAELEDLWELVLEGINNGEVIPLPVTSFARTEAEEAFRYMAQGIHIGKCMIDMTRNPEVPATYNCLGAKKALMPGNVPESTLPPLQLNPTLACRPDRSYIISGGLGGFGLAVAEFLSQAGAKHIVVTSKRGVRTGLQAAGLRELFLKGCNFKVSTLDVSIPEEAEQIVKLAESLAPLAGIFHLAMVLADKLIPNQTGNSWMQSVAPKAHGAYNLDKATRGIDTLEHFVMWSSFVASAGNEGQSNYGYANSCQDVLAERRRLEGLPALSIQWGVIDHVGVADKQIQRLMADGLLGASIAQPIDDCIRVLARLMCGGPKDSYGPVMASSWQKLDILTKSDAAGSKDILGAALKVLGLKESDVNDTDTLSSLGMDSMQSVEVRSVLQRGLGRPVSLDEVATFTIGSLRSDDGEDSAVAVAEAKKATEIAVEEVVAQKLEESDSAPTIVLPKDKPTEAALAKARVTRAKADAAKERLTRERLLAAAARANLPTAPMTPEKFNNVSTRSDSVTSFNLPAKEGSNGSQETSPRKMKLPAKLISAGGTIW